MEKVNDNDFLTFTQTEVFYPMLNFRWRIRNECQYPVGSVREVKTLEQVWTSNKGNTRWQEVPEFYDA